MSGLNRFPAKEMWSHKRSPRVRNPFAPPQTIVINWEWGMLPHG